MSPTISTESSNIMTYSVRQGAGLVCAGLKNACADWLRSGRGSGGESSNEDDLKEGRAAGRQRLFSPS